MSIFWGSPSSAEVAFTVLLPFLGGAELTKNNSVSGCPEVAVSVTSGPHTELRDWQASMAFGPSSSTALRHANPESADRYLVGEETKNVGQALLFDLVHLSPPY
jgi:hypothetical protein